MSKVNACKIKERLRQVPTLKLIFLKELKLMDLRELSLLKNRSFFRHDFIILLFFYLNLGLHSLQRCI